AAARQALGWSSAAFVVPQAIYDAWDAKPRGERLQHEGYERFAKYAEEHPALAAEFERRMAGALPDTFEASAAKLVAAQAAKAESIATRKASQQAIEAFAKALPEM